MDVTFEAMEVEDNLPEFTLAEILQMENLFKKMREKTIIEEFCRVLSMKFNGSIHRAEKSHIKWEQVQSWFLDKHMKSESAVVPFKPKKRNDGLKTAMIIKRAKVPTIPASEAAVELQTLIFEAKSAKDSAWFDVASFLSYRVAHCGDLLVRARFAGFGKEEDEWVSVTRAVRPRSIPLEHSECDKVHVGDLVLCFRESEDHALYGDAHVVGIERKVHDSSKCTCVFAVRWEHDNLEGKVTAEQLCTRPNNSAARESEDRKLVAPLQPTGTQRLLQLF